MCFYKAVVSWFIETQANMFYFHWVEFCTRVSAPLSSSYLVSHAVNVSLRSDITLLIHPIHCNLDAFVANNVILLRYLQYSININESETRMFVNSLVCLPVLIRLLVKAVTYDKSHQTLIKKKHVVCLSPPLYTTPATLDCLKFDQPFFINPHFHVYYILLHWQWIHVSAFIPEQKWVIHSSTHWPSYVPDPAWPSLQSFISCTRIKHKKYKSWR